MRGWTGSGAGGQGKVVSRLAPQFGQGFCIRDEPECQPVVAVALAGWSGSVIEDMALMATTPGAVIFGTRQDQLEVSLGGDPAADGFEKTRPAGPAFIFGR